MKNNNKTSNPTIVIEELSRNHAYVDLIDNEAFIFFPEKSQWRKRIIKSLEIWVERPDNYELQQFYDYYKIPKTTMEMWREMYPEIEDAMQKTKLSLGSKRRLGALNKKLDREMVLRDLHRYDDKDRTEHENNVYHKDMNKQDTHQASTIIIQGGVLPKPVVITKKQMEESSNEIV